MIWRFGIAMIFLISLESDGQDNVEKEDDFLRNDALNIYAQVDASFILLSFVQNE